MHEKSAPSNVCNWLHKCCELFLPYLVCPQIAKTELGHCLTVEKETEEMEHEQHYWTLLKTTKTIGARIDESMCEGIKRRQQNQHKHIFITNNFWREKAQILDGDKSLLSACVKSLYPHMLSNGVYLEKLCIQQCAYANIRIKK